MMGSLRSSKRVLAIIVVSGGLAVSNCLFYSYF